MLVGEYNITQTDICTQIDTFHFLFPYLKAIENLTHKHVMYFAKSCFTTCPFNFKKKDT